jgi:hypothetical protein
MSSLLYKEILPKIINKFAPTLASPYATLTMDLNQSQHDTAALLESHSSIKTSGLESFCPLDYGKHSATSSVDTTLGSLQVLPAEIKQLALSFLDIQTLFTFRALSSSVMAVVNASTAFVSWSKTRRMRCAWPLQSVPTTLTQSPICWPHSAHAPALIAAHSRST